VARNIPKIEEIVFRILEIWGWFFVYSYRNRSVGSEFDIHWRRRSDVGEKEDHVYERNTKNRGNSIPNFGDMGLVFCVFL
jgi:hypothetical protein